MCPLIEARDVRPLCRHPTRRLLATTFSHLQPPSTSIATHAASPPTIYNRSIVLPGFPCIPPSSSVVASNQLPQNQLQSLKTQDPRRPKLQTLAPLDNRQDRVSLSDVRHLAARGASGSSSVGGDESCFGVKFILFSMFSCFRFGLRLSFCFRSVSCASRFVCSIKYHLAPSPEGRLLQEKCPVIDRQKTGNQERHFHSFSHTACPSAFYFRPSNRLYEPYIQTPLDPAPRTRLAPAWLVLRPFCAAPFALLRSAASSAQTAPNCALTECGFVPPLFQLLLLARA